MRGEEGSGAVLLKEFTPKMQIPAQNEIWAFSYLRDEGQRLTD